MNEWSSGLVLLEGLEVCVVWLFVCVCVRWGERVEWTSHRDICGLVLACFGAQFSYDFKFTVDCTLFSGFCISSDLL